MEHHKDKTNYYSKLYGGLFPVDIRADPQPSRGLSLQKKLTIVRIILTAIVFLLLVIFNIIINDTLQNEKVYVTSTGHCYHINSCLTYKGGRSLTIKKAEQEGYSRCSLCNPWHHHLFYTLLLYAIVALLSHTVFLGLQWIIEARVKNKENAIRAEEAKAFCAEFNQQRASKLFGMPGYYHVGFDLIPALVPPYDKEYGVYAGASTYHLASCRYAQGKCISKYQAADAGLCPCKVCNPPRLFEFCDWYISYSRWARKAYLLGVFVEIKDDIITVATERVITP